MPEEQVSFANGIFTVGEKTFPFKKLAAELNDHTPVVQTGKESRNLGELVIALNGSKLTVTSYRLLPIDDRNAMPPSGR